MVPFPSHFPNGNIFLNQLDTESVHFNYWRLSKLRENGNHIFLMSPFVPAVAMVMLMKTEGQWTVLQLKWTGNAGCPAGGGELLHPRSRVCILGTVVVEDAWQVCSLAALPTLQHT